MSDQLSLRLVPDELDTLSGHRGKQGSGQPLHRLASSAEADANRRIICPSSYTRLGSAIGGDYNDIDSCDEFPFAGTYESGTLNGVTDGNQCSQVTAVEGAPGASTESLAWNQITVNSYTAADKCVRGHIPYKLNTSAGGAYGSFVQTQRVIEDDPFWVAVF